jgi:hypothetical protein
MKAKRPIWRGGGNYNTWTPYALAGIVLVASLIPR